jgi:hypothetical protein
MQHRRVIAGEGRRELCERPVQELPGEVHRHLPGEGEVGPPAATPERACQAAEGRRGLVEDAVDGEGGRKPGPQVGQHLEGEGLVHLTAEQARVGEQAGEDAFEPAHVAADLDGDARGEARVEDEAERPSLDLKDSEPERRLGGIDGGDHAPFEACADPRGELGKVRGRPVGGEDQRPPRVLPGDQALDEPRLHRLLPDE